jgi:hypothetical protein
MIKWAEQVAAPDRNRASLRHTACNRHENLFTSEGLTVPNSEGAYVDESSGFLIT